VAFAAYRDAVAADDGRTAGALVTSETLEHAAYLRDLALYATRAELEAEPVGAEMHVLLLRLRLSAVELEAMDDRAVFAFGVEHGFISNLWQARDELRQFQPEPSGAGWAGRRVRREREVGARLRFLREDGEWRLDLLPEFRRLSELIQEAATRNGVPERDLARARVELYTMKSLEPRHLEPLRPRAGG
jgi:hypothetical protein